MLENHIGLGYLRLGVLVQKPIRPHIEDDSVPVLISTVTTVDSKRDLGVVLDSQLTMSVHVSSMCRSAYYQLRQLRPVIRSLSVDDAR